MPFTWLWPSGKADIAMGGKGQAEGMGDAEESRYPGLVVVGQSLDAGVGVDRSGTRTGIDLSMNENSKRDEIAHSFVEGTVPPGSRACYADMVIS